MNRLDLRDLRCSLLLLLTAVFYGIFILRTVITIDGRLYFSLFDDAMISMRYGRNLAEGLGLVWNAGEHVEGYTNFLWTLWMAVLHLLPVSDAKTSLLVSLSSAAALLLNLIIVMKVADRVSGRSPTVRWLALLLTALFYSLTFWSLRGMEVGILALLISSGVLLVFDMEEGFTLARIIGLCLVLSGLVLVRPDGAVPAFVLIAFAGWMAKRKDRAKVLICLSATVVLVLAAHSLFRLYYYGDLLPNTYYLKMTGVPLATRISRGIAAYGELVSDSLFPFFLVVGLYALGHSSAFREKKVLLLVALFSAASLYSMYVGGDAWEWASFANRYVSIGIPCLIVLVAVSLEGLRRTDTSRLTLLSLLALTLLVQRPWIPPHLRWPLAVILALVPVVYRGGRPGFQKRAMTALFLGAAAALSAATYLGLSTLLSPSLSASSMLKRIVVSAFLIAIFLLLIRDIAAFKGQQKTVLLKPARTGSRVMATLIVIAICFFVNNEGYREWAKTAGVNVNADSEMTKLGVRIRQCTEADSRVAVVWAGALPYFSRRYSVDLLGKCDPVIARRNPKGNGFYPGHNKWDYVYSIERYQPDLIVQLWQQNSEDVKEILSRGYVETKDGYFIKKESLAKMGCLLSSTNPRPSRSVDEHPQGG
ncbi:MAG TPA: hypothetical protein VKF36_05840 [Syntrophorhabdales bacterium]|nr:hypothetical protein [Syntrophorhabdales bacterium]